MFESGQFRVVKALAQGDTTEDILAALCDAVGEQSNGGLVSILILEVEGHRLRHGAAPDLPHDFNMAIDGIEIGPNKGACGTAAYTGERVIVEDIAVDPLWRDYRDLAARFGFRSCWSQPIRSATGAILGTFAFYFRERRRPNTFELRLVEEASYLASIVIERKRSEDALRRSEERFRDYAESASDWFWETDAAGRITYLSDSYFKYVDVVREETIGRKRSEFLPETPCPEWEAHLATMAVRQPFKDFIFTRRLRDGSIAWLSSSGKPAFGGSGEFMGYRGAISEITERLLARERERMREFQLQQIIDLVPHYISVRDKNGHYLMANRATAEVYGKSPEEVVGLSVSETLRDPEQRASFMANDRKVLASRRPMFVPEQKITFRDGKVRTIDSSKIPFVAPGSHTPSVLTVSVDITERKEAEEKLRRQAAELAHVQRLNAVGQLSSALAHELNQPLAATGGYVHASRQLLKNVGRGRVSKVRELLDKAAGQIERAGDIISRLRSFIDSGQSVRTEQDINAIVRNACAIALVGARDSNIVVTYDLDNGISPVLVDRIQIEQVMFNLVRNAIEAMEGAVRRELKIGSACRDGDVTVVVTDTGPGVSDEISSRLFEPFTTTKETGMGVGLSISRSIIEAHDGKIWAGANLGGGMRFVFTLPTARHKEETASYGAAAYLRQS